MSGITWILDEGILERLIYGSRKLPDVIREQGHEVLLSQRAPSGSYESFPDMAGPVVLYGSHEFVKQTRGPGIQPGVLGVNERTRVTSYMSNLPLEWFLNRDGFFCTWAMFKERRGHEFIRDLSPGGLFLRPDSGFKVFAGQRIMDDDLDDHISTLEQTSGVMPETLVFMAPLREIQGEFRFVIADRQVIAGSEYRWDGKLDVRRDWPAPCEQLAWKVAQHEWQVDIAYTCDVALVDGEARLVELNGFSCAGLYACELNKVVQGISAAALREWRGDDI